MTNPTDLDAQHRLRLPPSFAIKSVVQSPDCRREAVRSSCKLDQPSSEQIAGFGHVQDAGAVLMPDLIARGGQAVRRPKEDRGRAGVHDRPEVLAGRADRQVVEAVVVEVARGQDVAEEVAGLGGALDAGDVLVPELVAECGEAARRARRAR